MMKKMMFSALCSLLLCHTLLFPVTGECQESGNVVEIEYDGKIIAVDLADLILMTDENGEQGVELYDPALYAEQLENAPFYGQGEFQTDTFRDAAPVNLPPGVQEITQEEYDEEQRARRWANIIEDLSLREIDEKALELVREYGEAKNSVSPVTGDVGTLVVSHSTYIPKIICRPMYVTAVMLQPGEIVTGVHPGDPVRWSFVPSSSGSGDTEQMHVLIKPLMADISTNLVINTDRRTYHLDLVASATDHIPSVSFSYPADTLSDWNDFISQKRADRQ